jgi:urea transport system permease protein
MNVMSQWIDTEHNQAGQWLAGLFFLLLCAACMFSAGARADDTNNKDDYQTLLTKLVSASYSEKEAIISSLVELDDKRVLAVLKAMLNSNLYYTKADEKLVIVSEQNDSFMLDDAVTGGRPGPAEKDSVEKIKTNNKLRSLLRGEIAKLSLKNENKDIRLAAVLEIMQDINASSAELLKAALVTEKAESVKDGMITAIALYDLESDDKDVKFDAINQLKGSLYPQIKVALTRIANEEAGSTVELDNKIHKAAKSALSSIDSKLELNAFIENIFFGLSLGSVLLLAAIGLAITFGVMGIINMAHGELIMLGAYTTYMIQGLVPEYLDYSLFISIPAAFIVSGIFGVIIERGVIRFLYGRPLETLLATFGISLILQQLVRTTISAQNVIVSSPSWMSGSLQINPILSVTYNRLYIIVFSLLVFVALLYILKRTVLGLQVRAVSQNRAMAKAIGVRSDWVDALTFGLGSGIAGIAGVALSQLTNVGPNLGQSYIIDSFMVVVFGGVGNLWGTLVAAMSLGVVNKFLEPWAGAVLAKILVLVFIILFIQKRPRGLFPKKGRAADD